ncbi:MAG TPA: N-acetyltransferase [Actinophytocola sp.]|nr:N-acetyltransferase [Actinophytocola sp.]
MRHPLLKIFLDAARGMFPPADGAVVHLPPLGNGLAAVVSLTARAYLAADHLPADLDGFGAALQPEVLRELAGPAGVIETLDVTLAAPGLGGGGLPARSDLDDHPRVQLARGLRSEVRVHGDERGLVTVAHGLAGRTEMSVETLGDKGFGRELINEARRLVPAGEPVFAAVAPGNARSLRAFLAAGFVPLGSEVILRTAN